MKNLRSRLPPSAETLQVLAVIAFPIYAWTITVFLFTFPSYLNFFNPGEIGVLFAYSMTSAFIESLVYLGILLILCLILPGDALRNVFLTRGACAAIFGLGYLIIYVYIFSQQSFALIVQLPFWSLLGILLTLGAAYYSTRARGVPAAMAWISDRLLVFLFLFTPLSGICLLIVLYRHIAL